MNIFKWMFDEDIKFTIPKKKIIQIATKQDGVLIALCNDGSLWDYRNKNWSRIEGIPE